MLRILNMDNEISFSIESISEGHHRVSYRGIKLIKDPFDYLLYQMIINEVKPDLIIEIGTNHGASALYMADMLDLLGNGMIHTMDIMEYPMHPLIVNNPRIKRFLGGFEDYDLKYENPLMHDSLLNKLRKNPTVWCPFLSGSKVG